MTRQGVLEYVEAIRERYRRVKRREKVNILDEAVQVTGCHRKALIRLLGRGVWPAPRRRKRLLRRG